ncbi:hypothetical protein MMMDOFMJ_2178 [Methylobacterium gnaphalii]|uniref:Uncharacterized protein n=2 Tax=Methylobacterium gnaphalii TaxID=1010610 RepID=A0A512JKT6_9HYPH|nr:hypothetical protein MGN01_23680 [Methylobacterium gnaphalii]GJD69250.1 hypothetical protein MMMDOFMJ_2178 [Methylobacterium gnaphalii]GLS47913.1 hypothetical protein GCM10007885_07570 [Methylobacterium gnaphalii]
MIDRPSFGPVVRLSKPIGFVVTGFTIAVGLGVGAFVSLNDYGMPVFHLFLPIAGMLLAEVIVVASARDMAAIQFKLAPC